MILHFSNLLTASVTTVVELYSESCQQPSETFDVLLVILALQVLIDMKLPWQMKLE